MTLELPLADLAEKCPSGTEHSHKMGLYLDYYFSTAQNRHLWQQKQVNFLHSYLICVVQLFEYQKYILLRDIWWFKIVICVYYFSAAKNRHLWQHKQVNFLHSYQICVVQLFE
jgi:hypothetical protein